MADKKQPGWANPLAKTEGGQTPIVPEGWGPPRVEHVEVTFPEAHPSWPEDNSDLDRGSVRPSGVGLREGEITALDQIAARYDLARNALLRLAARRLILDYRTGQLDLSGLLEPKTPKREPKQKLRYPKK